MAAYITRMAEELGEDYIDDADIEPPLVTLLDALAFDAARPARRLIELLTERAWTGWTKLERVDPTRRAAATRQDIALRRSRSAGEDPGGGGVDFG